MIGRIVGYETSQDASNSDISLVKESKCSKKQCLDLPPTGSVTVGIVNKYKQIMSSMKVVANRIVAKSSTSFIIGVIVMFTMLISVISWFRWSTDTPSVDDHHYCVSTKSSSFISIPLWELSLSPVFAGTSDVDFDAAPDEVGGQKSWLFSIIIFVSIMILFIVKSQTPFNSTKPKIITGIWSELEHRQFIEGYNMHGKSWRLVSAFIPTRTEAQVRAHGCYWLKIHSPLTMKRTRKQEPTIFGSPSSVSSAMSTPKKSNKTLFLTPSKGILRVKNENQLPKQVVTPKSGGRASRMRQMEGSKSDPVKRVKIVSP